MFEIRRFNLFLIMYRDKHDRHATIFQGELQWTFHLIFLLKALQENQQWKQQVHLPTQIRQKRWVLWLV